MPSTIKDSPLLLTVSQAAELMQLGRDTVYQLTHRPDFPALRLGRSVRINRELLQVWLSPLCTRITGVPPPWPLFWTGRSTPATR